MDCGTRVLGHNDGAIGTDVPHLVQKPGFAEIGIQHMDAQGLSILDQGFDMGANIHAVGPDGDQHHVFCEIDEGLFE